MNELTWCFSHILCFCPPWTNSILKSTFFACSHFSDQTILEMSSCWCQKGRWYKVTWDCVITPFYWSPWKHVKGLSTKEAKTYLFFFLARGCKQRAKPALAEDLLLCFSCITNSSSIGSRGWRIKQHWHLSNKGQRSAVWKNSTPWLFQPPPDRNGWTAFRPERRKAVTATSSTPLVSRSRLNLRLGHKSPPSGEPWHSAPTWFLPHGGLCPEGGPGISGPAIHHGSLVVGAEAPVGSTCPRVFTLVAKTTPAAVESTSSPTAFPRGQRSFEVVRQPCMSKDTLLRWHSHAGPVDNPLGILLRGRAKGWDLLTEGHT